MRIETISYLKQNAANLELEEPMVITQSGKPVYRIESEHQAQRKDEAIALLRLMNLAERDIRSGNTMTPEEAKEALKSVDKKG
ncbi:type II toxin-antitoxin system Phd/YefM family antitoxin [Alkalimarinus alittae]|uniref:Type II toxin-antitoxin system Phd/YefM family antitoxin n=1 Tax=Alkalimarinus alittae TaxID=2961619 RepID=A0ABY6N669_9ALTE|nr:type II toxin-antitoxin system Phd/YefM family antitoxin [Alkalimarinus alittae]UZE97617.1 type II toxin-antitoxin system Phd/YefM family antitoxin [Alkalimarinus alittae]